MLLTIVSMNQPAESANAGLVMPHSRRCLCKMSHLLKIPISGCVIATCSRICRDAMASCGSENVDKSRSRYSRSSDQLRKTRVRPEGFSANDRRSTIVAISGIAIKVLKKRGKEEREREKIGEKNETARGG